MTLSRILSAAAGALGAGSATTSTTSVPTTVLFDHDADAVEPVDRQYPGHYPHYAHHHFAHYPQNPYTAISEHLYEDDASLYHSPYGLHNQGFHVKYGMADPGTGYGAPQQPHSYYGAPASTGYGQHQSYQPQAAYHPQPAVHHHEAPAPVPPQHSNPRTHKTQSSHSKSNASAMSALTLLAFLFFLNILQSCLKEHMMTMNPTVMVMTAGAGRRASFKSNLDTSLPETDSDVESEEEAEAAKKIDYSVYAPDVDAKMFGPEFGSDPPALKHRAAKSNRTIPAKLMRDVRFGHVVRRT